MSRPISRAQLATRWVLGPLFIAAGVMHFVRPEFYARMVPPYLPWPRELVFASGLAEVVGGLALFVPRLRVAAAWGLIALLVAVFPANVHMALNPDEFPNIPPLALWIRLPLQAVLIAWAHWFTRREESRV